MIIKNITFLVFNYSNDIYISNLYKKIKFSELKGYLNMENEKVKYLINMINDMNLTNKIRLVICMSYS